MKPSLKIAVQTERLASIFPILRAAALAVGVIAGPLLLRAGGDPWKDKPYQQWDMKDVRQVLGDSPWAKVIRIGALSAGGDAEQDAGNIGSRGQGEGSGNGREAADEPGESGDEHPRTIFIVRWYSSRAIREAIVRGAILGGTMKQEDADQLLAKPSEEYSLLVLGSNLNAFDKLDEAALKAKTSLTARKTKQKIAPDKIEIRRGPDGKKIVAVVFGFPQKTATGEPFISTSEKNVEFACTPPGVSLHVNFEPQKMTDKQGQDL